jgi:hypothetical protein
MSLFGSILQKLGIGGGAAAGRSASPSPAGSAGSATGTRGPSPSPSAPATGGTTSATTAAPASPTRAAPASPTPAAPVDISAELEKRAAANPQKLNWRTSIVDLLKLLDIDSSLDARKQLATELGCPPELMSDSAKMNVWLHKAVLAKVAANGGVVPKELLD